MAASLSKRAITSAGARGDRGPRRLARILQRFCLVGSLIGPILVGTALAQNWELVSRSPANDEFHIDRSTLLRDGDMRRIWMLANYAGPIDSGARSLRFLAEYRCDAEEWRTVEVLETAAPMGAGEARRRNSGFGEWREVDAESVIELVMRAVCSE